MPRSTAKNDGAHALDIDLAAERAIRYCAGMTREGFIADDKTREATLHALLVIGEATKRLTAEFRAAHPIIRWDDMAGMRDRLIHGYDAVDFDIVWEVVRSHLPELRRELAPLLQQPR